MMTEGEAGTDPPIEEQPAPPVGSTGADAPPESDSGANAQGEGPDGAADAQDLPAAEGSAEDDAAEDVERDLEQLQDPAAEAASMRELAQRTQADFENFRKRARQNEAQAGERGMARLAGELLAALDNFELALAAAGSTDQDPATEATVRGFSLIRDELLAGLGRAGIEIDRPAEGERFDPQVHEAIAHVPSADGVEAGSIVAVHQAGYRIGATVIRPARVAVSGG